MKEKNDNPRKISVSIGGVYYHLISEENDDYTREIAQKSDDAIRQISKQNTSLSNTQATILALVNTMDALTKINPCIAEARNDVEKANMRAKKAQDELFALRDEDFELRKELFRINELNKQLELEIAALRNQQNILPEDRQTFEIDQTIDPKLFVPDAEKTLAEELDDTDEDFDEDNKEESFGDYKQPSIEELFP